MESSIEMDLLASVLHFPSGIAIDSAHASAAELVIRVVCRQLSMACPVCQQSSARIHGRYQRTVADLPCAGRNVILALTVRKFVCGTPTCPRKIFTERLPDLVQSYARMFNDDCWMTTKTMANVHVKTLYVVLYIAQFFTLRT